MGVFYGWILIVSLVNFQGIFPLYGTLHLREIASGALVLISLLNVRNARKYSTLWMFAYAITVYTLFTVFRSDYYDFYTQLKLFARLIIFFLPVFAVPALVKSHSSARHLFLFATFVSSILALSAPLQELVGPIPELYSVDNWEWDHGRAGFARYLSLFGDPNIGGMLGGLLPLTLLILEDKRKSTRARTFMLESLVWAVSIVLVSYALSFTGIVILGIATFIVLLTGEGFRVRRFLHLGMLSLIALASPLSARLIGVIKSFLTPGEPVVSPISTGLDLSYLLADLSFRLFAYIDTNNTFGSIMFGSTYNVVVPNAHFNPLAILAHNGFKEIYLAGGLVGLSLYIALFVITALKAYHLLRSYRQLTDSIAGTALAAATTYLILVVVMWVFPVYHYNGIGIVFWISVGLVHAFYQETVSASAKMKVLQAVPHV